MNKAKALTEVIQDYEDEEKHVGESRSLTIETIRAVVNSEIIPEVKKRLPVPFDLDPSNTSVIRYDYQPGFFVNLRLTYEGKPVSLEGDDEGSKHLLVVQRNLEPLLDSLGQQYGLKQLRAFGEPLETGVRQ